MRKKRIASALNIRVNLGNYQHVQLTKYVDEVIEFDNDEQRVELEDRLHNELLTQMKKELEATPKHFKLGQDAEVIQKVEEAIATSIPAWLENDPVPNIANAALDAHEHTIQEQEDNVKKQEDKIAGSNPILDVEEDESGVLWGVFEKKLGD